MTRTLPWLTQKAQPTRASPAQSRSPRPAKRQRTLNLTDHIDAPQSPPQSPSLLPPSTPTPKPSPLSRRSHSARFPSTSPPPAPPTEEFMHDGLDADDIYMLVEDDFLSTAHLFTRHLHHAEYNRLKRQARTRNPATMTTLARPVDGRAVLSPEAKHQKVQAERKARIDKALAPSASAKASGVRAETKSKMGGEEEPEEAHRRRVEDATKDDELWKGTHLHGLLTSPGAELKPLRGLQGVASKTRAAAGYKRPEKAEQGRGRMYDLHPRPVRKIEAEKAKHTVGQDTAWTDSGSATEVGDDDDDDLDGPANKAIPRGAKKVKAPKSSDSFAAKPPRQPQKAVAFAAEPELISRKLVARVQESLRGDIMDDFSKPTPLPNGRSWARRKRSEFDEAGKERGKEGIDEIPIFLV